MTTSGTMNDSEWDNEWQRIRNDNEWYNEQKRMKASKREWFWVQNETKYAMCNYNILRNIDYL